MSPAERLQVLLFLAFFFGATGFLSMLLSCGTEYWLLAAESCSRPGGTTGGHVMRDEKGSTKVLNIQLSTWNTVKLGHGVLME